MGKRKERAKKLFADKELAQTKHYSKRYAATVLSIISALICVLTVVGVFLIARYFSEENYEALRAFVDEHYLIGSLLFILVCAVQVIVAFIPGEIVEVAAGVMFGSVMGTIWCMIGATLGSVAAILMVRNFGRKFVESLYPREKIDSLPILREPKKRNAVVFLLFLIPGTPKDLFTYVVGLTEMSIPMYLLLTMVARIPSILMSTVSGDAFGEGKLMKAVMIFLASALVSGIGYLIYLAVQKKLNKK